MNKMNELGASALSQHEMDCLRLLADGRDTTLIAAQLGRPVGEIEQTLDHAATQMGASSRLHAVIKAMRLGLFG
jgi:DNA-binding CsgD family transcriptional regulator